MLDIFKNMRVLVTKKVNEEIIIINDVTKRMKFSGGWIIW